MTATSKPPLSYRDAGVDIEAGERLVDAISPMAIVPDVLTDAWSNGTATALSISVALSKKAGKPLPWAPVKAVRYCWVLTVAESPN